MGLTEAIFAPSEKELPSKSLFILHKCKSTMLADNFTNFVGIVSVPVAFLMFMLIYVQDFDFRYYKSFSQFQIFSYF